MTVRRSEAVIARYPADVDRLRKMIEEDGLTRFQAGQELGIPSYAVDVHCQVNQIRSGWKPRNGTLRLDPGRIRELLAEGKNGTEIAEALGVDPKAVYKAAKKHGIELPRRGPRGGEKHDNWGGGRTYDKHGYVMVHCPGHPMARRNGAGRTPTYVPEHRLVMAEHLGRMLTDDEVVHHKDGNPQNNAIENLELFAKNSEHLRHELTGRCPNWTEDGKRRIREGVARAWQARKLRASQKESGEDD